MSPGVEEESATTREKKNAFVYWETKPRRVTVCGIICFHVMSQLAFMDFLCWPISFSLVWSYADSPYVSASKQQMV